MKINQCSISSPFFRVPNIRMACIKKYSSYSGNNKNESYFTTAALCFFFVVKSYIWCWTRQFLSKIYISTFDVIARCTLLKTMTPKQQSSGPFCFVRIWRMNFLSGINVTICVYNVNICPNISYLGLLLVPCFTF